MRARVARPRGHRPGRGGACLARAHAVGPAGAGRLQLPLVVDARRRRRLPRRRPRALGAVRREPGPAADRGAARRAGARGGRRGPASSAPGARGEHPRRPRAAPRGHRAGHRRAPGRLLLRRVRHPRLAADLLRRARRAGRRHPQGGLRPRAAAGRRRAAVPPRLLPPAHRRARAGSTSTGSDRPRAPAVALVTGDDGEPLTVTVPVGAEQVVAQVWRVDVGRVPLFLLDADRPENGAVARWITSRLYVGDARHAPGPVPAARRRRRAGAAGAGHRPGGRAPQRGPRRLRLARAGARRAGRGRLARRRAGRGPRAHGLHHPHAGAGGQRHLRGRARRATRCARWPARSASTSTRSSASGARAPTTTASRSA